MKTQANRSPYLPPLIVGIAVILFSTAGIARMMGWGPNATDDSGDILELDILPVARAQPVAVRAQTGPGEAAGNARAKGRCAECGVIVSVREIDARDEGAGPGATSGAVAGNQDELPVTSRHYAITVRLADGSSRVINDANPASWRPGERLIVIDGANPSNR